MVTRRLLRNLEKKIEIAEKEHAEAIAAESTEGEGAAVSE